MIKVNDYEVTIEHYPDGTPRIKLDTLNYLLNCNPQTILIKWVYESDAELCYLMMIKKHFENYRNTYKHILQMDYVPNARMDRVKNHDEVFTLKYFCEFINWLNFDIVYILDPHSNVVPALINRCWKLDTRACVNCAISDIEKDNSEVVLYFPDAGAQLRRLDNKAIRTVEQSKREEHILNSIKNAYATFPEKYFGFEEDSIKLYIDKAIQEDYDTEIFMDVHLKHYPLRDYKAMWSEMNNIVKDYSKIGHRNKHAATHDKLGKHMMHLIRLYLMCLDILERKQIVTKRAEHDLLMDIRNGKYLDGDNQPVSEFYDMVDDFEKKLKYAAENTELPDKPDYKKIDEFVASVNEKVVRGEL